MNVGNRIQKLRKENNMTQDNLADYLQISRQSISKWEANLSYPETEKLIKLSKLFNVSVDYLLTGNTETKLAKNYHYEYKSKKKIFGLPLIHINFGLGFYQAKGIIAIGTISTGLISIGFLSLGLLAFGLLSLGGLALGSIAIGIISLGAISIGILSIGALSIGLFSVGALSVGKYIALGDHAYGNIALGKTYAEGIIYQENLKYYDKELVKNLLDDVPKIWKIFKEIYKLFL